MRFKPVASRVALTRLQAAGMIESPERSFWRLTRKSPWSRDVERWRTVKSRTKPWDGAWIVALANAVPRSQRTVRGYTERALRHRGFRELRRDAFMRPSNLRASLGEVEVDLISLGASSSVGLLIASELGFTPPLGAWRIAEHQARIAAARARMTALIDGPPRDPAEACRAFWHAGRDVLRLVNADPLLPDESPIRRRAASCSIACPSSWCAAAMRGSICSGCRGFAKIRGRPTASNRVRWLRARPRAPHDDDDDRSMRDGRRARELIHEARHATRRRAGGAVSS